MQNSIANQQLKTLISEKFKNEATFARHIGWPRQKLNKIVLGKKVPDVHEVGVIADGLNEPIGKIARIFLNQ